MYNYGKVWYTLLPVPHPPIRILEKFSPSLEMLTSTNPWKFSPSKDSHYTVGSTYIGATYIHAEQLHLHDKHDDNVPVLQCDAYSHIHMRENSGAQWSLSET